MYRGTLAIAGECMCTRPFSMHQEPAFLDLIKVLRGADTSYCHMEMNIFGKGSGYAGRPYAVSALQADPVIANELKWAGIDLVSCAYNHGLDWGLAGLLGTIENLDRVGIVHAGTGNNLEEAREPAYFESRGGRVAIISMSSGHHPYDSASPCKSAVRGRPGVNPLRVVQKYVVDKDSIEKLKEIWAKIGLATKRPLFAQEEEGDTYFTSGDQGGGAPTLIFRAGDEPGVLSYVNHWDLEGNLRAIRDAKRQADLVLVAHHAAINDGARGEKPSRVVPALAKQCIDAGADVFIGHGWHRQLGIEIYKNRPIFYGTGNFFAQSQFLQRFPYDAYEGHAFSPNEISILTPADLHDARENHMGHWKQQPGGVVAVLDVDGENLSDVKLYPFTLGYDYGVVSKSEHVREVGTRMDGRPILADQENGERIIGHVKQLSEAFNTCIEYKDGMGIIKIK